MRVLYILILFLLFNVDSMAQHAVLKGNVTDTLNKQNLPNAVISLIGFNDSILHSFTRADKNGNFNLLKLKQGKYFVLVTYPTYADYYDTVSIFENNSFDIGIIKLTPKAHLLADVTVVSKIAAVRMKGDTIVYKADSFKVKQGASVEDLIKQFPGIQVDKNGNITAHGTRVEKVLVDGEEFFADDPTIATKNLNADMVNEVQVFDKKSDQATFTGVDDGKTIRTINLKLKDNAKKGWFGKLETGIAIKDRWNNSLMANSFKNKKKLSFYGIASSTGKTGLNWDEMGKYGSASDGGYMYDDGSTVVFEGNGDFDGFEYFGQGIPKSWSGGINYSNKFNKDKQSINGSYKYAKIINEGAGYTNTQSILPDTIFFNNEKNNTYGVRDKHQANGSFDWLVDSLLSIKTTVTSSIGSNSGLSNYYSEALNEQNKYVNNSIINKVTKGESKNLNVNFLLRKKFKKVGRTLSLNITENVINKTNNGYLYSENNFYYDNGLLNFSDTTDQNKLSDNNTNNFKTKLSLTEQLSKSILLEVNYGYQLNNYVNKVLSLDKNNNTGKYDNLNSKFSNNFKFTNSTNLFGSMVKYTKKKLNATIGGTVSFANFKQKDLIKDTIGNYRFTNVYPIAMVIYKFNNNKRLSFDYKGNTKQPSINQLQPISDNNNPLFIQQGNPNLIQEFNHNFSVRFNNYQVLKNRGFYVSFRYNTTDNAIRNSTYTDSLGRSINKYINIKGNNYFNSQLGYNTKIEKLDLYFYLDYEFSLNKSTSVVNKLKNTNISNSHNFSFGISKEKESKYNLWLYNVIMYNSSTSSIRSDINTKYWSAAISADFTYYFPHKIELNNSIELELRQKTALFSGNNNIAIWNIYVAKKIFKGDKSQLRFTAFDILNQKRSYERSINSNTLTETGYQQLSQYFMFSFIWNFSKGGALAK
jgi:hypothetical protein